MEGAAASAAKDTPLAGALASAAAIEEDDRCAVTLIAPCTDYTGQVKGCTQLGSAECAAADGCVNVCAGTCSPELLNALVLRLLTLCSAAAWGKLTHQ